MNFVSVVAIWLFFAAHAVAGTLDPVSVPASGSNMPTLQGIYDQLATGIAAPLLTGPFNEPSAGPTTGSGKSLNDIMGRLPQVDNLNGARAGNVLSGKTFWGLRSDGTWGLQTGTLVDNRKPDTLIDQFSSISSISTPGTGNMPTAGGWLITLSGHFVADPENQSQAPDADQITCSNLVLKVGGVSIACSGIISMTNDAIIFTAPALTGTAAITMTIAGYPVPLTTSVVAANGQYGYQKNFSPQIRYDAPRVTSASGCIDDQGGTARGCSQMGGDVITITGSNFGSSAQSVSITVSGLTCSNVVVVIPNTGLRCTLPASPAFGATENLVVTVNGQSSQPFMIGYFGPELVPGMITLYPVPASASTGAVTIPDATVPTRVSMKARFIGSNEADTEVRFGPPGTPFDQMPYRAVIVRGSYSVDMLNMTTTFTVVVPPGTGQHVFGIKIGLSKAIGADTMTYPVPTIIAGSLRGELTAPGSSMLIGRSALGDWIHFDALNVSASSGFIHDGLVSWWQGNDSANDIVNANNGIMEGSAALAAAGYTGQAFSFNGANDGSVNIPDSESLHLSRFSLIAWFKWNATGTANISYLMGKGAENFEISTGGSGVNSLHFTPAGSSATTVDAPNVIRNGWNHLAVTYSGSEAHIYMNGTHVAGKTGISGANSLAADIAPLMLGSRGDGSLAFNGLIDEVQLYNRALGEAEILASYQGGSSGKLKVTFGDPTASPSGDTFNRECTFITVPDPAGYPHTLRCFTGAGAGSGLAFKLYSLNMSSPVGTDFYSYPFVPSVTISALSGCTASAATVTGCPTRGGSLITVTGSGFSVLPEELQVMVGTAYVQRVTALSATSITFELPPGTGSQPLQIRSASYLADNNGVISYAPPALTKVSGCSDQDATTLGCPQAGGATIILHGTNLGEAGGSIFVKGVYAGQVSHDPAMPHEVITFTLPEGFGWNVPVQYINRSGEASSVMMFSYSD